MKTLIICISIHHGNTKKIAKVMADILSADILEPVDVDTNNLEEYDLIGFGSGIYFGRHHKSLLNLIDRLPHLKDRKAFIFSASGIKNIRFINNYDRVLRKKLSKKINIIGEFSCRGFDTYGPFKYIGGISKGMPNEKDLENAGNFARGLKND